MVKSLYNSQRNLIEIFQKEKEDSHPDSKGKDRSNMKKRTAHSKSEMSFKEPCIIGSIRVKLLIILIHSLENYNIWMCSMKNSQGALKTREGETTHLYMDSDDEVLDAKIDAYIEEGANVGGEFPINKDVTLRQDMLSKHLAKLRVSTNSYIY